MARAGSAGTDRDASDEDRAERLRSIGEQTSAVVREAADVLEQELAGGLDEARRLQQQFTERRRVEPGDLDELAARVRRNGHDLIDVVSERLAEMEAEDVRELSDRFTKDAHEILNAVMDLVDLAPGLINKMAERVGVGERQADSAGEPSAARTTRKTTAKTTRKTTPRKSSPRKSAG